MGLIYLDTCLLIYAVEGHPLHDAPLEAALDAVPLERFAISPLVKLECLVGPARDGDGVLRRRYETMFGQMTTVSMPESVHREAAALRGRFGLKTPDALHLACAQHHRCSALWTNDGRLLRAGRGMVRNLLA